MSNGSSPTDSFPLGALPTLLTTKVFGRTIRYYDIGKGSPLVLVHGIGGDADQWAFVLDELATKHRIIAFDLPGFGRSDKPLLDYRVEVWVEFLDRFLKAINLPRASLLGHSYGGWIVASFALAFPDRVDRLVLVDAAGIDAGAQPLPVDLNVSTRRNMREAFECMFFDQRMVSDGLVDLAYGLHLERGDAPTIRCALASLEGTRDKLDGRLGALKAPTLVVWGENDRVTPVAMAHEFHRALPNAELAVIPRCGHFPLIENPGAFSSAVLMFLAR